ncbi:MAG: Alanine racemase [uncultured Sphingomonas sp.]|uniref:alanine racemase n=1 Tax=uncultured Sphingomonas sp. TaxID=158754 RepID=A0A6J4SG79_9SPHN|nr:alanine racemase [uncultured Sphingomonas sp.]CAA9498151.1 MAG: Alanine racemase [uncultured Sphingomonas sp.]
MHRPLRLTCSKDALVANWRTLAGRAGVACGAAIKADGYGLGALPVLDALYEAGCRDFFVSTWWEVAELGAVPADASLSVLHGLGPADIGPALQWTGARPVLNTVQQVERWKQIAPERECDVMIDTGMNRLGLRRDEAGALTGLNIHTLHSHLACGEEDHPLNRLQLERFRSAAADIAATRYSLANSAAIFLGREYSFDLVRPGLAIYGGVPRREAREQIRPVVRLEAQVVQRRLIRAGESCGYGGLFVAQDDTEAAIVNLGYADGYWRGFSGRGRAEVGGVDLPVLGRVSMDLVALSCDGASELAEGDWVSLHFALEEAAQASGMSQYELLTGLGRRFERLWH